MVSLIYESIILIWSFSTLRYCWNWTLKASDCSGCGCWELKTLEIVLIWVSTRSVALLISVVDLKLEFDVYFEWIFDGSLSLVFDMKFLLRDRSREWLCLRSISVSYFASSYFSIWGFEYFSWAIWACFYITFSRTVCFSSYFSGNLSWDFFID